MSITIGNSLVPKAVPVIVAKKADENITRVSEQEAVVKVKAKKTEITYETFKTYVQSKELTIEFMTKIKEKFPEYFEKLRKEMTQ